MPTLLCIMSTSCTAIQHRFEQGDITFQLVCCSSGTLSLNLCHTTPPNVILLSDHLPDMSPTEWLTSYHTYPEPAPIIVLATPGQKTLLASLLRQGIDSYLWKDADSMELLPDVVRNTYVRSMQARGFRTLSDHLPDLIYRYRLVAPVGFEFVSQGATAVTGYTPEEHYADPDLGFKLVHPEDQPKLRAVMQVASKGEPLVLRWLRKDGRIIWTEQRNVTLYDEQGQAIAIEGIARDITARIEGGMVLRESEERYRSMIAALAEGIVMQDRNGKIYTCNASAERILGLTVDQMTGRDSLDPRWRAIREDGSPFPGEAHPAMVTLRTGRAQYHVIMGVYKPDDSLTWISVNSQPLWREGEDLPYAVVASFSDITDLKRAEQQAIDLGIEKARSKLLTDFISDTSHELRHPLAVIGTSAYLMSRTAEPEKRREQLATIEDQINQLDAVIEDLHMMVRLDSMKNLTLTRINLNQMVQEAAQEVQAQLHGQAQRLCWQLQTDLPLIYGDFDLLRMAYLHLLSNASRYSPAHSTITVTTGIDHGQAQLAVQDEGVGISADRLPHIFERFYKTNQARTRDRSHAGLGLAMVKKIVEMHGGQVGVVSAPGQGSLFWIHLPGHSL